MAKELLALAVSSKVRSSISGRQAKAAFWAACRRFFGLEFSLHSSLSPLTDDTLNTVRAPHSDLYFTARRTASTADFSLTAAQLEVSRLVAWQGGPGLRCSRRTLPSQETLDNSGPVCDSSSPRPCSGNNQLRRMWALLIWAAASFRLAHAQWDQEWIAGASYLHPWYQRPWVGQVTDFYCDDTCDARLREAPTVDREFKALVNLFNQSTGGVRDVYRGAFEGLDEFKAAANPSVLSRHQASLNQWTRSYGWDSIIDAHTSTTTLCTELKLDGNASFDRSFCYDNINSTAAGPIFPDPVWSVIQDCCLEFNRTVSVSFSHLTP